MTLPLYHADIVGSAVSVAGQWFIYKKAWWGWLLSAVAGLFFMYVNAACGVWGMEPITVMLTVMSIRSAIKWRSCA